MVMNRKGAVTAAALPAAIAMGAVLSLAITLLGAMIVAALVNSQIIMEDGMGYGVLLILLLASATGALAAAKKRGHQRMLSCLGVGGVYFLCLLSCTALFFGGQYSGVGVTAIVIFAGSACVGLMGLRTRNTGRKIKGIRRSC